MSFHMITLKPKNKDNTILCHVDTDASIVYIKQKMCMQIRY